MTPDAVRAWFLATSEHVAADPEWRPGDIIADWSRHFAPMGTADAILPDAPGALFSVRSWRHKSWDGPAPDDERADFEVGPTAGGFALRTSAGRVVHDRDVARRILPPDTGLAGAFLAELPASRRAETEGRGTDRVALIRALAWWSLRHAGMSKAGAARSVIEWEGGAPDTADGRPDKGHLRTLYQAAERTLERVGIS